MCEVTLCNFRPSRKQWHVQEAHNGGYNGVAGHMPRAERAEEYTQLISPLIPSAVALFYTAGAAVVLLTSINNVDIIFFTQDRRCCSILTDSLNSCITMFKRGINMIIRYTILKCVIEHCLSGNKTIEYIKINSLNESGDRVEGGGRQFTRRVQNKAMLHFMLSTWPLITHTRTSTRYFRYLHFKESPSVITSPPSKECLRLSY